MIVASEHRFPRIPKQLGRLLGAVGVGVAFQHFADASLIGAELVRNDVLVVELPVQNVDRHSLYLGQCFALNRDFVEFHTRQRVYRGCHAYFPSPVLRMVKARRAANPARHVPILGAIHLDSSTSGCLSCCFARRTA